VRSRNISSNPRRRAHLTTIALIGAGRVATALGVCLERADYRVVAVSGRKGSRDRAQRHLPFARFVVPEEASPMAEVVVFGVPDDLIGKGCLAMGEAGAFREGQRVLHLSGSVGLDVLDPARAAGAEVLSVHPLQSIPEVEEGIERLPGSYMAVTGGSERAFRFGEALVRAVGGEPFPLPDEAKPLYHAAAVFCANYLVVVEAIAEELFRAAGVEEPLAKMAPLVRTAFERTLLHGPADALTGPAARGDAGTVSRNLAALVERAPHTAPTYWMLAYQAGRIAHESGRLSNEGLARLERVLQDVRDRVTDA
jgi:predicted short-subunit dehydrogenase-like oxidoreductase (DUF2520 family)